MPRTEFDGSGFGESSGNFTEEFQPFPDLSELEISGFGSEFSSFGSDMVRNQDPIPYWIADIEHGNQPLDFEAFSLNQIHSKVRIVVRFL